LSFIQRLLTKYKDSIIAIIDSISYSRNKFNISFDFDPIPVHFLHIINPKTWLARNFIIVIVISTPKHQIFLIEIDKSASFLGRFGIGDDLFNPNIGFGAHRSIQKPQLVKIIEKMIGHFVLIGYHPLSSEKIEKISL
jgi:hypothetical protein